jgi:hypothetical protein
MANKFTPVGLSEGFNIERPELLKGSGYWDFLQFKQISDYLKALQEIFGGEPFAPENKIGKVYACLLGLEFLVQAKLQRNPEEVIDGYAHIRLDGRTISQFEQSGKYYDAIAAFHSWALALEPYFRSLRSAEPATLVAGQGIVGDD